MTRSLTPAAVLAGYDAVAPLYEAIPPLCIWRACEYAAWRTLSLSEPIIDLGCGDGRYFRLLWPDARDVVGVDQDPAVVSLARQSGVYREVHQLAADDLPATGFGPFRSAFANCSMEHMDRLDAVLSATARVLVPGGTLLTSVVTDRILRWATLTDLVSLAAGPEAGDAVQRAYSEYHHLVNPLPVGEWIDRLLAAGFEVVEHIAIVPEFTSRLFLLMDQAWHLGMPDGELGASLHARFRGLPGIGLAGRKLLEATLLLEENWTDTSGAIFVARRV